MRAQELLALYRRNPREFASLAQDYKSDFNPVRAPHRLAVWLKRDDLVYKQYGDILAGGSKGLVRVFSRPDYFGYILQLGDGDSAKAEYFAQASPAAVGTLLYIAFETRRMFNAMHPGRKFEPLPVTSLVEPEDRALLAGRKEGLSHTSGQVFDVNYSALPADELEALRFVLDDLGWDGYLGFVEEGTQNLHIGCSPTSREFFTTVFQEAIGPLKSE
jgi:hypothetical protein